MLSVVCFSKDRPLQLEAYLESLMYFGGIKPEHITVLVASSSGINYDGLIAQHPGINWVREKAFRDDLLQVLRGAENFILLGCDDVVFKEFFDANDCIRTLQKDGDVFGFSLRLGANLNFIPTLDENDGIFTWSWREAKGEYWRYPWEVSASIYRRDFVIDYLTSRPDVTNPNRFEAYLADHIAKDGAEIPPKLACFAESSSATITVNRVQDEYPNDFDKAKDTSSKALYRDHVNGLKQNWVKLARWRNRSVHVGADAFELVRSFAIPPVGYAVTSDGDVRTRPGSRGLALKILWWRIMTVVWEETRKRVPRRVLMVFKSISRRVIRGLP
jgi:hypothetical protein